VEGSHLRQSASTQNCLQNWASCLLPSRPTHPLLRPANASDARETRKAAEGNKKVSESRLKKSKEEKEEGEGGRKGEAGRRWRNSKWVMTYSCQFITI
jgi:hypothetical protein